ncbi:hypothetical protein BC834DRAFT_1033087 [Gloeopeniophorella convolvens]|nr:hypothetical protein BC834DRAFT_1033087 [Gloeopeniophorella convolvens]
MSHEHSDTGRGRGRGRGRGNGRGRGYHRGGVPAVPKLQPPVLLRDIHEGLDTAQKFEVIPPPETPAGADVPKDIPIKDVKYVASYNWVDAKDPTIAVPGSPALWTERAVPFTLQPDDGSNFIDQNGARLAAYPMLPLFAAADVIHGEDSPVEWPELDIVTDRNAMRKLLRWLSPPAPETGRQLNDFRIDVQLVGEKTIFLSRWEGMLHNPPTGRSYGFAFEAAVTRPAPGCPGTGHHRAIAYDLLDLKMVVRFEVDACLDPKDRATSTTESQESTAASPDDLADTLASLSLAFSPAEAKKNAPNAPVAITRGGTLVPQDALLEVASRSTYFVHALDWSELYPQLVLSQTPMLRLGVHERGTFTRVQEWGLDAPDLAPQRAATNAQLVRLARVLEDVQALAISRGPGPVGKISLLCEGGELRVYVRTDSKSCLPTDMIARFGFGADVNAEAW